MSGSTHTVIGLDNRRMFPTYYFSANDRNPDEKLFAEGFNRTRLLSMRDPDVPRITFGIHSWQDKNSMKKLDGFYAKYLRSPEFWNATENEYAAYRYSFYNANPVRTKLDGNTAVYELTRFEPAFLGAETPLQLHFTEKPLEVRLNGKRIEPDPDGNFTLPHDPGRRLPLFVEALEKNDLSTKFPGLSVKLSVDLEKNTAEAEIINQSGKQLDHSVFTLILPPHWLQMSQSIPIGMLKSGESKKMQINLGSVEKDLDIMAQNTISLENLIFWTGTFKQNIPDSTLTFLFLPLKILQFFLLQDTIYTSQIGAVNIVIVVLAVGLINSKMGKAILYSMKAEFRGSCRCIQYAVEREFSHSLHLSGEDRSPPERRNRQFPNCYLDEFFGIKTVCI